MWQPTCLCGLCWWLFWYFRWGKPLVAVPTCTTFTHIATSERVCNLHNQSEFLLQCMIVRDHVMKMMRCLILVGTRCIFWSPSLLWCRTINYPTTIAANPRKRNQFALGFNTGDVLVVESIEDTSEEIFKSDEGVVNDEREHMQRIEDQCGCFDHIQFRLRSFLMRSFHVGSHAKLLAENTVNQFRSSTPKHPQCWNSTFWTRDLNCKESYLPLCF